MYKQESKSKKKEEKGKKKRETKTKPFFYLFFFQVFILGGWNVELREYNSPKTDTRNVC
jgi:hypothetical protein